MKKITDFIDTPSVRVFQTFAGESLEKLDQFEVWDIVTVLCQAVASANLPITSSTFIQTKGLAEMMELGASEDAQTCINALDHFPTDQVNKLMGALLAVAFEEDLT